jgi:hypothetical protein
MDKATVNKLMRQYVVAHPSIARTKKEYQLEERLLTWDGAKTIQQNSDACGYRSVTAAHHLAKMLDLPHAAKEGQDQPVTEGGEEVISWNKVRGFLIKILMKRELLSVAMKAISDPGVLEFAATKVERKKRKYTRRASRKYGPRHSDAYYRKHWNPSMTVKGLVRIFKIHPVSVMKKSRQLGLPYKRTKMGEKRLATMMKRATLNGQVTHVPARQVVETV